MSSVPECLTRGRTRVGSLLEPTRLYPHVLCGLNYMEDLPYKFGLWGWVRRSARWYHPFWGMRGSIRRLSAKHCCLTEWWFPRLHGLPMLVWIFITTHYTCIWGSFPKKKMRAPQTVDVYLPCCRAWLSWQLSLNSDICWFLSICLLLCAFLGHAFIVVKVNRCLGLKHYTSRSSYFLMKQLIHKGARTEWVLIIISHYNTHRRWLDTIWFGNCIPVQQYLTQWPRWSALPVCLSVSLPHPNRSRQMAAHRQSGSAQGFSLFKGCFSLPLLQSACSWWDLLGLFE